MPKNVYYKISSDRQNKLLKSALKEFIEKPYDKITVASLTNTMKILRTDFYYYFSDKEDIYQETLDRFYNMVTAVNNEANFHDALLIVFDKVVSMCAGVRNRQYLIDLTENFHPQFAKELTKRVRSMFHCECTGDKPQVKVMTKIYKFMTIVNLYAKAELSLDSAKEMLNDK